MGRGRSKAGGGGANSRSGMSDSQIMSKLNTKGFELGSLPKLEGYQNDDERKTAAKARKEMFNDLWQYANTRLAPGVAVSPTKVNEYFEASKSERATLDLIKRNASQATFGNDSLLPQKLQNEINFYNNISDRRSKVTEIMSTNKLKKASYWNKGGYYYFGDRGSVKSPREVFKDYIDGKIDKLPDEKNLRRL